MFKLKLLYRIYIFFHESYEIFLKLIVLPYLKSCLSPLDCLIVSCTSYYVFYEIILQTESFSRIINIICLLSFFYLYLLRFIDKDEYDLTITRLIGLIFMVYFIFFGKYMACSLVGVCSIGKHEDNILKKLHLLFMKDGPESEIKKVFPRLSRSLSNVQSITPNRFKLVTFGALTLLSLGAGYEAWTIDHLMGDTYIKLNAASNDCRLEAAVSRNSLEHVDSVRELNSLKSEAHIKLGASKNLFLTKHINCHTIDSYQDFLEIKRSRSIPDEIKIRPEFYKR